MFFLLIFATICGALAETEEQYYDTYTGEFLTEEEFKTYVDKNLTFWCTGKFRECDPKEGRRFDQTCTNLQYPTRGTSHSPYIRALPALWGEDFEPVRKANGEEMEPARKVRMESLAEGDVPDPNFTILLTHYMLFVLATQTSFHDTINFMQWTPNCCLPSGKNEPMCAPHKIPENDPVHKFTGLRCMNQTKPLTFQSVGCIGRDDAEYPQRINSATSFFDLAMIYGPDDSHRSFKDGMLKVDEEGGKIWPYQAEVGTGNCIQNAMPQETRCHKQSAINALLGVNFVGIQFWRQHNHIAKELKKVNRCWDDQKLFDVAREINIAYLSQIFFYELLPLFMGRQNLLNEGIISRDGGFRKMFRENVTPQMAIEYSYLWRWGHTILPGMLKMYDTEGNIFDEVPITNLTLRTGYLALGNHLEGITQGSIRQPNGKADQVVDPIVSNTGLGNLQRAFDLPTADLSKGGLQGIANYASFVKYCSGREIKTFEDLLVDVLPQYIDVMKYSHEDVSDVPALLGTWLEKPIPGGIVPRTLYCISVKQYRRFMETDRHWYEDPDRPNAFTRSQLREIRKMTIARTLCDVGDTITEIMPNAFIRENPSNRMVSCDRIRKINFNAWRAC